MSFLKFGFLGGGAGGGAGALLIAKKADGKDAVFSSLQALQTYYNTNPKPKTNEAAVVGTASPAGDTTSIQVAYVWRGGKWDATATNFKGDKGDKGNVGPQGRGMQALDTIPENHIAKVSGGTLVDAHAMQKDGVLFPLDNEIQLGIESLIGAGENVLIVNKARKEIRSPVYQIVGPNVETASVRSHSEIQTRTYPDNGDRLVNPDYKITMVRNATLYAVHVNVLAPITNVLIEIFVDGYNDRPCWKLQVPSMPTGRFEPSFNVSPVMLKNGGTYRIKWSSPDGDVVLSGDSGTGIPFTDMVVTEWTEKELATKDWVSLLMAGSARTPNPITMPSVVTHVSVDDNGNLIITYNGGAKQKIPSSSFTGGGAPGVPAPAITALQNEMKTVESKLAAEGTDIDAIKKELGAVEHRTDSLQGVFNYRGTSIPTFPSDPKSAYFINFYGSQNKSENLPLPAPSGGALKPGAIVYVANEDINTNIRVSSTTGSIDGASALNVPPGNFLLVAKKPGGWQNLASGFIPSSMKRIELDIKSKLLKDPNELTSLASDLSSALEKLGFVKGSAGGGGVTLINPDGSRHKVTELKLVDMQVVDPGDGTPPKLVHMDQHHDKPKPSSTSAYAFFSASPTPPEKAGAFTSLPVYRDGKVTVHKDTGDPQYVYILLPPGEGDDVQRVGEVGGLPSYWAKQSKDYPNRGQSRVYTVLRSPYKFHEQDLTFVLYP